MNYIEIIGFFAAICTTVAFMPQVIQAWRTKSTKDINLKMYAILCLGFLLWLLYGIFVKSLPIILANAISLVSASTILFLKILHG